MFARVASTRPHRQSAATRSSEHDATTHSSNYVVMNVFQVKPESSTDFEEIWKTRESRLKQMPGFVRFAMLRCENVSGKYISQTYWQTKEDFQNWTKSSQFAASHGGGDQSSKDQEVKRPNTMSMLEGPPVPEVFSTVTITE